MAKDPLCCSKSFLDSVSSSQFPLLRASLKSNYQTTSGRRQQKKEFPQCCRDCSDSYFYQGVLILAAGWKQIQLYLCNS